MNEIIRVGNGFVRIKGFLTEEHRQHIRKIVETEKLSYAKIEIEIFLLRHDYTIVEGKVNSYMVSI